MVHRGTTNRIVEAERDLLRALCQGMLEASQRAAALKTLSDHTFRDRAHQIVFDALREIASADPRVIREQLPARLNNKGFPELDWESFFETHHLKPTQAAALLLKLGAKTAGEGRPSRGKPYST